jgi:hypothetical protein
VEKAISDQAEELKNLTAELKQHRWALKQRTSVHALEDEVAGESVESGRARLKRNKAKVSYWCKAIDEMSSKVRKCWVGVRLHTVALTFYTQSLTCAHTVMHAR